MAVFFNEIEAQLYKWLETFSADPDAFVAGGEFLMFLAAMFFIWSALFDLIPSLLCYLNQKALYYYCKRTGRTKWKTLGEVFKDAIKAYRERKNDHREGD